MSDQHVKGVVNKVVGTVEEVAGKATGDTNLEVRGKVKRVKGTAQEGLADVQDTIRKAAPRY